MEHIKLQLGALIVLIYIAFIYLRECKKYHRELTETLFDELLLLGVISVILDGATAFTVNNLDIVHPVVNTILHALFLVSLDAVIFVLFLYMLHITETYPKGRKYQILLFLPFVLNVIVVVCFIDGLEYVEGAYTNYSMGVSAYTCYIMSAIYIILTVATFFRSWKKIESHRRTSIFTYLVILVSVTTIQMIFPEILISSIAVTIFIIGIYMNQEDPALRELSKYHNETVMSFANLIENRDNNTGGHIKRTVRYVRLITDELRERDYYSDILTDEYVANLLKSAPMHDIGKISVPDAVLCKPGRLTNEEFEQMKQHTEKGGDIIRETFRNLGNEEYRKVAFEVARFHHEKWNGKGYPDGLKRKEIPLCARIMAVADVFDAISENRCYRAAMPMDKCFEIIAQGSGQDFDPLIAELFVEIRDKVEAAHADLAGSSDDDVHKLF